jgi:ribosomal protein S25
MSSKLYPQKCGKIDDWTLFNYDIKKEKELSKIYDDMAHRLMQLHSEGANFISRKDNNEIFEIAYSLKHIAERIKEKYEYDPEILNTLYKKALDLSIEDKRLITDNFLADKLNCSLSYAKKINKMIND